MTGLGIDGADRSLLCDRLVEIYGDQLPIRQFGGHVPGR